MNISKTILKNNKGMALVIVLTASFIVLVTISVGAVMLAANLDKLASVVNRNKADENIQSAFERVRSMEKINNTYLSGCNTGDCINTSNATCGGCAKTIVDLGNGNQQKVQITSITQPQASGGIGTYVAGSVNILVTGLYKNLAKQKSFSVCLNYCAVAGYNCGSNGCNGSCGICTAPNTCGGGGLTGVCGNTPVCPNDVSQECNSACNNGDSCGGGTVVDKTNHVVAVLGGCTTTAGVGCGGGDDSLTLAWDTGTLATTSATDANDGRNNATTLRTLGGGTINAEFAAVKFCDDLSFDSFIHWYIPSSNELASLYTASTNGWIAHYAKNQYWSSTESSNKNATEDNFNGGSSGAANKATPLYIRCLRRF